MGKIKETILSLGYARRQAEELERELKQAGIKEPEEEKAEVIKPVLRKNISEVKSIDEGGD